jgi:hypothetical protein
VHALCGGAAAAYGAFNALAAALITSLRMLTSGVAAAAFDASYVLAFMLAGTFLVYAVLILVMRNVFVREEQEGKLAPNKTAATAPAPATTSAPAQVSIPCLLS